MQETSLKFLSLSPDEEAFLKRYRFDPHPFRELRDELLHGRFPPERNRLDATLRAPTSDDLVPWPTEAALKNLGAEAIERGQVGVVILNGGMATRFGGRVKGIVEVVDERSFLDLKLSDLTRWSADIPVFLMNSFATERDTLNHLEARELLLETPISEAELIQVVEQQLLPRPAQHQQHDRGPTRLHPPSTPRAATLPRRRCCRSCSRNLPAALRSVSLFRSVSTHPQSRQHNSISFPRASLARAPRQTLSIPLLP